MALPPAQTEAEAPLPPEQHPGDLGSLSDDELKQQYTKAQNPLAGMSDEELTRAYHQSNPTGSQGYPLSGPNWDEYMKTSQWGMCSMRLAKVLNRDGAPMISVCRLRYPMP